jgi:hypothetical protein
MIEPMRVVYLVAASLDQGVKDCRERGWQQIAYTRFVTTTREDVRVVCRGSDVTPFAGRTPMVKGSDYDEGPGEKAPEHMKDAWLKMRIDVDRFVEEGNGIWVELASGVPV